MRLELDNWLSDEIPPHLKTKVEFAIKFSENYSQKDLNIFLNFINEFKELRLSEKLSIQYRALVFTILSLSKNTNVRDTINPASKSNSDSYWYCVVNDFFNDDAEMIDFTTAVIFFADKLKAVKLYEWAQNQRDLALVSSTMGIIDDDLIEHELVNIIYLANQKIKKAENDYFEVLLKKFPKILTPEG